MMRMNFTRAYKVVPFLGAPKLQYVVVQHTLDDTFMILSDWLDEDDEDKALPLRPKHLEVMRHIGAYRLYDPATNNYLVLNDVGEELLRRGTTFRVVRSRDGKNFAITDIVRRYDD